MYHTCAEFNNFEAMRYFLTRKEKKYLDPIYIRNKNENSVLHTACHFGHLEIVKLVIVRMFNGFSSTEAFLLAKNLEGGLSCFLVACSKGHFNIVEYFLKDLKMNFFLESVDDNFNNGLHLASEQGHLSIVNILLDSGIDDQAKNKEGSTPLELSCRKGFFEISKLLIRNFKQSSQFSLPSAHSENPLHVACFEGAHEVVRLLLLKG